MPTPQQHNGRLFYLTFFFVEFLSTGMQWNKDTFKSRFQSNCFTFGMAFIQKTSGFLAPEGFCYSIYKIGWLVD